MSQGSVSKENSIYVENSTGKYFFPLDADDDWVVRAIRNDTVFDYHVIKTVLDNYRGGNILDIGSNFGQMSIQFWRFLEVFNKQNNTRYKVYSFEANPVVFTYLKLNLENNFNSESLIFGAVWNRPGRIVYFPHFSKEKQVTYGSYNVSLSEDGFPVSTVTVDSLLMRERVGAIKTDIQGADLRALEGCVATISKDRPFIITEFEPGYSKLFDDLYSDYLYFMKFMDYKIVNLPETPPSGAFETVNLCCVPKERD